MYQLILLAWMFLQAITQPTLLYDKGKFAVTYSPGAVWANVRYTAHIQKNDDGTPRVIYDNYQLSEGSTGFVDNVEVDCYTSSGSPCIDVWDMRVSIGYPHESTTVPGVTEVTYEESNTITFTQEAQ